MPYRDRDNRPAREGAVGPRVYPTSSTLRGQICGVLFEPSRVRNPRTIIKTWPTPTAVWQRSYSVCSPPRDLRTTQGHARDKIGSCMSRGDCERFLNDWISNYVLADDDASQVIKAEFPLREARIEVAEVAGKPGTYIAVMFIRPHFQLDELSVSLRLVVELPTRPNGIRQNPEQETSSYMTCMQPYARIRRRQRACQALATEGGCTTAKWGWTVPHLTF